MSSGLGAALGGEGEGGGGLRKQANRVKNSNTEVTMAAQTLPITQAPATNRGSVENLHTYHPTLTHTEEGTGAKNLAGYTSDASKLQAGKQWQAKQ